MESASKKISKKLQKARVASGFTQKQLAEKISLTENQYAHYEKGRAEPSIDTIYALCSILGESFDEWLGLSHPKERPITPQGQRIGRAYDKATPPVQKTVEVALEPYMDEHKPHLYVEPAEEEDKVISLYALDLPSSAGMGLYVGDSGGEMTDFPARVVPQGTDCAIHIEGDSMEPDIPDGAVVFVKYQPVIESGQIGIFIYDDEPMAYCKRFRRDAKGRPYMESINKKYAPVYLDDEFDTWRVFGRVLGVYTGE